MLLFQVLFLQLFWLAVILYGKLLSPLWPIAAALLFVGIHYKINRPQLSAGRFFFVTLFFLLFGWVNDSFLIFSNVVAKDSYHYGNLSLWIVFIIYYERIFLKFDKMALPLTSVIGGIGGCLAYWSAAKMGAVMILPEMELPYAFSQFFVWAVFFPISLKLYYKDSYWDYFLDKTIFFSFDQTGYRRHKKKFSENLAQKDLQGKKVLVTGATGGIGGEVAAFLSRLGPKVFITGRNQKKGEGFEAKNKNSKFISLDMANWKEVHEFAKNAEVLDYVVFNAGSMPEKLSVNENGVEFQCASQLLGHYYLLSWLAEFKKLNPGARIVWVSSGGMYLKQLDLKSLFENPHYEKVETYANVKRAQVTLVEELAKKREWDNFFIYSMHPGWVATEGLKEALPQFYRFMQNRLRTPEEGADTILWCLLAEKSPESGGFYFDRKKVSPYISKKYFPVDSERDFLMKAIEEKKPHF